MDLLTKEEALRFLENILDIPSSEVLDLSDKSLADSTKLSFLERLLRAFLEREPFQSISLMSVDVSKRRRPSWDEIKHDLLLGKGGICYWMNAFMFALLSALGTDASLTFSTFYTGRPSVNNHLIVLLHDLLTPGSLHLVDVGLGYYIPRAVSLDFSLESEEFTDSFMTYKFERESDTAMYLLKKVEQDTAAASAARNEDVEKKHQQNQHKSKDCEEGEKNLQDKLHAIKETVNKDGDLQRVVNQPGINNESDKKKDTNQSKINNEEDRQQDVNTKQHATLNEIKNDASSQPFTWQQLYIFNPSVALKTLEPFFQCFDECFTDVTRLGTHSSPRAMHWPGGRYLALVNSNLIQEVTPGKLTKTRIVDVNVRPKPQLTPPNDSDLKTAEFKASAEAQNGSENTCNKSLNETVTNDNDDGSESKASDLMTLEKSASTHGKNATETVPNSNKTGDIESIDNTDGQREVQLSELDPLVEAYEHYFPQYPKQLVLAALKNWIATGTLYPVPQHLA